MKYCKRCLENCETHDLIVIVSEDYDYCFICGDELEYAKIDIVIYFLKQKPHKILDIPDPTERMWIAAIKNNINLFPLCKQQTENIQLQAVSGNGKMIIFCDNPSINVWKKAIQQNPYVIENLEGTEFYYEELCEYALNITDKVRKCVKDYDLMYEIQELTTKARELENENKDLRYRIRLFEFG